MDVYDELNLTDAERALAETIAETRKIDKSLAAVCAKAGGNAAEIVTGALKAAAATSAAANAAAQKPNNDAAARIEQLTQQIGDVTKQYDAAVANKKLGSLIGYKNKLAELNRELNDLRAQAG